MLTVVKHKQIRLFHVCMMAGTAHVRAAWGGSGCTVAVGDGSDGERFMTKYILSDLRLPVLLPSSPAAAVTRKSPPKREGLSAPPWLWGTAAVGSILLVLIRRSACCSTSRLRIQTGRVSHAAAATMSFPSWLMSEALAPARVLVKSCRRRTVASVLALLLFSPLGALATPQATAPPAPPPVSPPPSPPRPSEARHHHNATSGLPPVALERGRSLSTTVEISTFDELVTALAGTAATIRLAPGTYPVTSTLQLSRSVTIIAVDGDAVLDGQDARCVMLISSGSVELIGLNITKGHRNVRLPCRRLIPISAAWNFLPSPRWETFPGSVPLRADKACLCLLFAAYPLQSQPDGLCRM